MDLATSIATTRVNPGEVAMFWLGQAGFLLKDAQGHQFAIDPYLTDCGERLKGFKRLSPKLLEPQHLVPDVYLTTHFHFDHYDYDAIATVSANSKTLFCGPPTCVTLLEQEGIAPERIRRITPGDELVHEGIRVTATQADHGDMAPDAIGAVVEMGGQRIYFSGDTAYHPEYVAMVAALKPDVAVLSINGTFGNMDAETGARFARELGVKTAIPCHFWTFAEHRGDPLVFRQLLEAPPHCATPVCMRQGEMIVIA